MLILMTFGRDEYLRSVILNFGVFQLVVDI